jgi:hypothetical protein
LSLSNFLKFFRYKPRFLLKLSPIKASFYCHGAVLWPPTECRPILWLPLKILSVIVAIHYQRSPSQREKMESKGHLCCSSLPTLNLFNRSTTNHPDHCQNDHCIPATALNS